MKLTTLDYLKKALLDTQEKVRDFESYSKVIDDGEIKSNFKAWAEEEGYQASELQKLISKYSDTED